MNNIILDRNGLPYQVAPNPHFPIDGVGQSLYGWRRVSTYARGAQFFDPGSRLNTAWSLAKDEGDGTGILFDLSDTWGSPDWSGNYPGLSVPLLDIHGKQAQGDFATPMRIVIIARGTNPLSTDFVVCGANVCNHADPTDATIDGVGPGMLWDTTVGRPCRISTTNGAGSNNAGTGGAGFVQVSGVVYRVSKTGTNGVLDFARGNAHDIAGVRQGSAIGDGSVVDTTLGKLHLHLFAGRTSVAGVLDVDLRLDCYYTPPVCRRHPV